MDNYDDNDCTLHFVDTPLALLIVWNIVGEPVGLVASSKTEPQFVFEHVFLEAPIWSCRHLSMLWGLF